MAIAEDAKKLLESRIERIMGKIDVHDIDKEEIRKELRSHYYEVVLSKAQSRGSAAVEKVDVDAAFAEAEDPEDTAIAYMKSYIDSFARAGFVSRAIAYIIDIVIVIMMIALLILPIIVLVNAVPAILSMYLTDSLNAYMEIAELLRTITGFFTWIAVLVVLITYFIIVEGRFGYTPGKRLMRLRVLKEDGSKIGYKEAIIRNIPKFINQLIIIDALIMLFIYPKEKQRVFDKVAGTIVIHTNKKATETQ